jgi:hypothetical protein
MSEWQYRKYYGAKIGPDNDGWTGWADLYTGELYYNPTQLLLDAPGEGRIEFRKTPQDDPHCERCELAVEDLGLCFPHLNEELDLFNAEDDPWPDFEDERGLDLMSEESDSDSHFPAWEQDELDNYTGYGA